jgi:hypothetical protein
MGATYTRQSASAIATGEVIQASHSEDEFDQLVLAFTADSGHSHDGTSAEGGDVTKLLGTAITIGDGTAGTDIAVTFDGESNDGVLTWMEDEDQFKFSDDVMLIDNETLILGSDSDITIKYDEATNDALEIAANVEGAPLAIVLKADQGDDAGDEWKINVADGGVITFGNDLNSAGTYVTHMTMTPNATVANSTVAFAGNVTVATDLTVTGDLTVSGDDITMGTNTAGNLLVGDGSNYNPIALGGDVASINAAGSVTIANNAVSLAKMAGLARSNLIYGNSAGDPTALAIGSANTVLQSDGTDVGWTTVTSAMLAGSIADSKLSTISTADKVSGAAIQVDGATDGTSITVASTDKFLIDDAGTTKYINVSQLDAYITASDVLASELGVGDTTSSFTTTSGAVTIDSQASTTTIDGHTGVTIQSSNSGNILLDSVADIVLDAGGADITLKDDGTVFGAISNSGGEVVLKSGSSSTTAVTFSGANVAVAGTFTVDGSAIEAIAIALG